MLSRTQARPGRAVKQEQEQNSCNNVQAFLLVSVRLVLIQFITRQFHGILPFMYRDEIYSLQILLSRTKAGQGRTVKQEQEEISPNHIQRINLVSVQFESARFLYYFGLVKNRSFYQEPDLRMSKQSFIQLSWFRAFYPPLGGTVKRTLKRPTERAQICRRSSKGGKSLSASVAADSQHFARVCSQSRAVRRSVQCTPSYWNGQKYSS